MERSKDVSTTGATYDIKPLPLFLFFFFEVGGVTQEGRELFSETRVTAFFFFSKTQHA